MYAACMYILLDVSIVMYMNIYIKPIYFYLCNIVFYI